MVLGVRGERDEGGVLEGPKGGVWVPSDRQAAGVGGPPPLVTLVTLMTACWARGRGACLEPPNYVVRSGPNE